ncbi:MAG: ribonuclease H-like domain-containing protein, partial [Treponema sp.]|nr:ribonuclease H-like domain-containing protein [Treponema sp.]
MGSNLRSRLQRIRGLTPAAEREKPHAAGSGPRGTPGEVCPAMPPAPDAIGPGWIQAGYLTVKRTLLLEVPSFPRVFPPSLGILIPDLHRYTPGTAGPGDLLFFDLETTGLSSGAGTVAFLAAFGRMVPGNPNLEVTQYLLLDYPGEDDFLEAALAEFRREKTG